MEKEMGTLRPKMDGQAAVAQSIEHSLSEGLNLTKICTKKLNYFEAKKLYILKLKLIN